MRVASDISARPFKTFETVGSDTPARAAIVAMVTRGERLRCRSAVMVSLLQRGTHWRAGFRVGSACDLDGRAATLVVHAVLTGGAGNRQIAVAVSASGDGLWPPFVAYQRLQGVVCRFRGAIGTYQPRGRAQPCASIRQSPVRHGLDCWVRKGSAVMPLDLVCLTRLTVRCGWP